MRRFFRALIWLRWHLIVNSLRPTRKRDSLERASRVFQVLGPVLLFLIFVPAVLMMGVAGFAGGWFLATPGISHLLILILIRVVLTFECVLALLAPLMKAAQGSTPNLTRFLLLPVPSRLLYLCEALSGFADPWVAILTLGILLLPVGWMAAGGGAAGAGLALAAGAAMLALITGLGALSSSFAHLVFRNRRRGELASVLLLGVIALAGMLPGLLSTLSPVKRRLPDGRQKVEKMVAERPASPEAAPLPAWGWIYPPELYARSLALASAGRTAAGGLPLLALLLLAAGIHLVAGRIYRRLLETPEVQSSRRRGGAARARWLRIPGLSPAASAVALAQVRLIFRTVQGKLSFSLMPLVILVLGLIWLRGPQELQHARLPIPTGVLLASFGVFFSLLTLEGALLNQFAMDRAGLTLEFLSPISDRDLLAGKAAGGAMLAASRALFCFVPAVVVAPGGPLFLWLTVPVGGIAVYFILAPCGAILSMLLPKTMDLNRLGQAGKPHPGASLLGMLCMLVGAGPVLALGVAALFLLQSPAAAFVMVAGWAAVAAVISIPLYRVAERLLARRRENLALVAQGR